MEKRLEKLLQTKRFEELNAEEKYYVTESVGEAEYNRIYFLLNNSKNTFKKSPSVNPALKANLLAAFRKEHSIQEKKKPTVFVRLMRHKLPTWQMAAAIALLLGLHFWFQEEPRVIEKTDTVYVHTTDTIYKEVSLPTPATAPSKSLSRINVKPKKEIEAVVKEPVLLASADTSISRDYLTNAQLPDTFAINVSQPRGQSASQSADLWKMFEEVY